MPFLSKLIEHPNTLGIAKSSVGISSHHSSLKESGDGPGVALSAPHGCPVTALFPLDSRPQPTLE